MLRTATWHVATHLHCMAFYSNMHFQNLVFLPVTGQRPKATMKNPNDGGRRRKKYRSPSLKNYIELVAEEQRQDEKKRKVAVSLHTDNLTIRKGTFSS